MVGKRWRNRRRRAAGEPRVDDFFYDNPEAEAGQEATEPEVAASEPERDGTVEPALKDGVAVVRAPDTAVADPRDGETHGYAARAERGGGSAPGESDGPDDTSGADPSDRIDDGKRARRRGRFVAAGRWSRAVGITGLAAALVYGAGSGSIPALDLASVLDRETPESGAVPQQAGLTVIGDSTLGCAGPGLVGLDDPSVAEPEQRVRVSAGSAPSEALPQSVPVSDAGTATLGGIPGETPQEVAGRGDVATIFVEGSRWVRAAAEGSLAPGFAATQLGHSVKEQQWGMAATACGVAQDESWLLAGGDAPGRVERLILANPTGNPVTVSAEVLGVEGPVDVVGGSGIVVPPSGRQVVLLDALAPGEARPVVHVTTTGGPVVAALGDRWLEGTIDRGTEVTTPAAAPATSQVIPAVPAPRPDTADAATVRVAAPGEEAAVVQLRALTADGPVRLEQGVANVEPGAVVDVDVADLPPGTQGIEVTADTPVLAAAHVERRDEADGAGDLAWIPATTPAESLLGAPLATSGHEDIASSLSLTSLEGATMDVVTMVGGVVQVRGVSVPAASTHTVDLDPQTESVWVRPTQGTVSAAVIFTMEHTLGTQVTGLPLPVAPITREVRAVAPWLP